MDEAIGHIPGLLLLSVLSGKQDIPEVRYDRGEGHIYMAVGVKEAGKNVPALKVDCEIGLRMSRLASWTGDSDNSSVMDDYSYIRGEVRTVENI